ncbi:alkaline ceramidase 3-like [Ornithodoros turicata]|uniref:alkaline ceramidase 3-like n=1 Tax=Ornithodoros turicata TaxID=34597 RepID=UPI003139BBDF
MAPVLDGVWGEPTSTLDWCEKNYEVTRYIAEFWNTVSNLAMIVPPAYGAIKAWKKDIETRLFLCYAFLLVVGVGSWCFHMTLWFEMQLLDELPMVWGTLILVYTLAEMSKPAKQRNRFLMVALVLYGSVITAVYLTIKIPIFHQVAYGFLVAVTFLISFKLAWQRLFDVRLFAVAGLSYLIGFFVWNIDNVYCNELSNARTRLPGVLLPLTQFHALWHCFAGYGAYISILYCCQARCNYLQKKSRLKMGPVGLEIEVGDSETSQKRC